ncbi:MAG: ABC transporter ATP-binding protein, partial [Mycobacterium sp.]
RSRDFWGSATRLVKRLAPQRRLSIVVIALGITGTAIGVVVPRILGHATDLLFNGVIGRRLPAGITKAQAVAEARARGDNSFADLLSGMNVTPGQGVDFGAVGRALALALALYLIAALLIWTQARLLNATVQKTITALRSDVEDKLHRLPISYFDGRQRGELLSRITNDVDNIQSSLSLTISQLVTSILAVVTALAMMVSISPMLALITLLTLPMLLLVTRAITRRAQRLFMAQWTSTGRLNAHIEETYSGFTVVKTFGHQAAAREQFRSFNDDVYQAGFGAQFISGLVQPATTFIGNLGYVAVAVVGGVQVATGHITLGNIQAFIQYVRQFNNPLSQLAGIYNTLQSGVASAERVFDLLDAPEESPDPQQELPPPNGQGPQLSGRVEFERVNFAYRAGIPVIEDLSMLAEAGSTVAIVGPTGAGKTTLVNLLMRFYDVDSGRILVDGVDITTVSRQTLRSRIGMVLQDTWLFDGTIADNIAYGRPGASAEELMQAARAAYVDRFVHTLPAGYRTRVTSDGSNISAGEKQLITIARAYLARPQILILDEATSSVDTRTEALIQRAMRELRRDRTSFIIAHRLSTVREADRILV